MSTYAPFGEVIPDTQPLAITEGNPAINKATEWAVKGNSNSQTNPFPKERGAGARARYASNDITNRGTSAFIKIMSPDGAKPNPESASDAVSTVSESLSLLSTNSASQGYDKFFITDFSMDMTEKFQITEVFGDTQVVYYFGRSPIFMNVGGVLIDSPDNTWFTDWLVMYEKSIRGSKLAQNQQQIKLVLPSMTLVGSITAMRYAQESLNDVAIRFNFTMLVTSLTPTAPKPIGEPITNAANKINFTSGNAFLNQTGINQIKNQVGAVLANLTSPTTSVAGLGSSLLALGSSVNTLSGYSALTPVSSGVSDFIDGITSKVQSGFKSAASFLAPITTTLSAIRASIFAPIYGVMNSLSKLIGAVFGAAGIVSFLTALTAPIRNILGDIANIASQAMALGRLVGYGVSQIGRGLQTGFGIQSIYQEAVQNIKMAAGTISAIPLSIGSSTANLVRGGAISPGAAFLAFNPKKSLSRSATLSYGPRSTQTGASLSLTPSLNSSNLSPQMAILRGGFKTAATAAYL